MDYKITWKNTRTSGESTAKSISQLRGGRITLTQKGGDRNQYNLRGLTNPGTVSSETRGAKS